MHISFKSLILLPSPACGRGVGGEGCRLSAVLTNCIYVQVLFAFSLNPSPASGRGTCVHTLALAGRGAGGEGLSA